MKIMKSNRTPVRTAVSKDNVQQNEEKNIDVSSPFQGHACSRANSPYKRSLHRAESKKVDMPASRKSLAFSNQSGQMFRLLVVSQSNRTQVKLHDLWTL